MRFVNAVFTTDHKLIGQLYLVLGGFSAIIGTIYSVWIRMHLAHWNLSGIFLENAAFYNTIITLHAVIMIFFFVMPVLIGGFLRRGRGYVKVIIVQFITEKYNAFVGINQRKLKDISLPTGLNTGMVSNEESFEGCMKRRKDQRFFEGLSKQVHSLVGLHSWMKVNCWFKNGSAIPCREDQNVGASQCFSSFELLACTGPKTGTVAHEAKRWKVEPGANSITGSNYVIPQNFQCKIWGALLTLRTIYSRYSVFLNRNVNMVSTESSGSVNSKRGNLGKVVKVKKDEDFNFMPEEDDISPVSIFKFFQETLTQLCLTCVWFIIVRGEKLYTWGSQSSLTRREMDWIHGGKISEKANALSNVSDTLHGFCFRQCKTKPNKANF